MIGSSVAPLLPERRRWLVTGCAGFIGSNLVEALLANGQDVVGLDNLSTGYRTNLADVQAKVGKKFEGFKFLEGDIRDAASCDKACAGADFVLHHAAIASVPLSIEQPAYVHDVNVNGTLMMLEAARRAGVKRFVYASSSAVYGDCPNARQTEAEIGNPLSPYAATKRMNEIYGGLYGNLFGLETVGLRYFNIYGPRQDPGGAYSAVIPNWIEKMISGERVTINGSEAISRDFCFVEDVVQANVRAATAEDLRAEIFNVASGREVTLGQLFTQIQQALQDLGEPYDHLPVVGDYRAGDIHRSAADITKARERLGFDPKFDLAKGLAATVARPAKSDR